MIWEYTTKWFSFLSENFHNKKSQLRKKNNVWRVQILAELASFSNIAPFPFAVLQHQYGDHSDFGLRFSVLMN